MHHRTAHHQGGEECSLRGCHACWCEYLFSYLAYTRFRLSGPCLRLQPHGRPEPHAPAPRFLESLYAEVSARGIEVNGDKVADSLISAAGKPSCVSSALGAYTTGAGAKVMPGDDKDGTDGLLSTHAGPLDAHLVQVPGDESSIVSAQAMGNKGAVSGPSELIDPLNKNANVGKLGNGDIGPDLNKPQHDIAKDLKNPNSAVQQLEKCVGCDAAGMLGKIPPAIQSAASSIHLASANSTPQASQSASQSASPTPAPTSQASVSAVENVSPDLDVASGSKQPASHPVDGVANKAGNVMHGAPSALAVPASLLNKAGPSIGLSTGSAVSCHLPTVYDTDVFFSLPLSAHLLCQLACPCRLSTSSSPPCSRSAPCRRTPYPARPAPVQ